MFKPDLRGRGIARSLVKELIRLARDAGYSYLRLDSIEEFMLPAISRYRSFGFYDIPPYCFNPMKGSRFMELDLTFTWD
ncbi:MAG: GNAT family N-acetyltransferase [Synergistales bacterium]|nr:GNAT family N-acetyltransferase [Synergistales bacterium]